MVDLRYAADPAIEESGTACQGADLPPRFWPATSGRRECFCSRVRFDARKQLPFWVFFTDLIAGSCRASGFRSAIRASLRGALLRISDGKKAFQKQYLCRVSGEAIHVQAITRGRFRSVSVRGTHAASGRLASADGTSYAGVCPWSVRGRGSWP